MSATSKAAKSTRNGRSDPPPPNGDRGAVPRPPLLLVVGETSGSLHIRSALNCSTCRIEAVSTAQQVVLRIRKEPVPDLVFLDMDTPGTGGLDTLKTIREAHSGVKVVLLASAVDPRQIVRALRLGAHDFIAKPWTRSAITALVQSCMPGPINGASPVASEDLGNGSFFLAASPAMRRLQSLVMMVARTDVPVLCTGESGTGKEVVARMLHVRSSRRLHSFLKVNCAALPSELLESELFGYDQGAFTGAVRSKPGKFELCARGTIFLDEIAELPPQLQAKLLHVLQDGEFSRLGGRCRIRTDARVIAATNVDIRGALESKRLREDLYYRLNTVVIEIPPLRERREEIPVLLDHFVQRYGGQNGMPSRGISAPVLEFVQNYKWPGNVRELENFAKRYLVLGDRALAQMSSHLDQASGSEPPNEPDSAAPARSHALKSVTMGVKREAEISAICKALDQTHWNRKEAARLLEISYKTLLEKIRLYELGRQSNQQMR